MLFHTEKGIIAVSNDAIANIAGNAAAGCIGVRGLTITSVRDGLSHLLKREAMAVGVDVADHGDGTVDLTVRIAVDNGVSIPMVCENIRNEVSYHVLNATGIPVSQVHIFVDSVKG
jgi:uncharacterized alkaline shock family protein YloU